MVKHHLAMRRAEEARKRAKVMRAGAIADARTHGASLKDIADALQVTPERVRQMATEEDR